MKSSLSTARSRVPADEDDEESSAPVSRGAGGAGGMPDLASMMAGMGGGGGGMPDLSAMMQNPAIMQMAQNMMQGGGLEQLMNNPVRPSRAILGDLRCVARADSDSS